MSEENSEREADAAVLLDFVSVIVPTRNEAANVEPLLRRLAQAMGGAPFAVIFVDDSDDETPQAVERARAQFDFPIRLIARPPAARNGLSGAVVDGFRAARGEWVCVMDADLQHPPEMIPALLARAREADADIVVGSRQAGMWGPRGLSRQRALTSQALTFLARAWFPRLLKNVSDPLTGLFLARRAAIDLEALRPDGFKILLEILIRCPGLRVSELHFAFAPRRDGESKADFREGMRFFRHLLRLRATANRSFPRLIAVAVGSALLDTAVFVLLTQLTGWPFWLTAVLAAELFILLRFGVTEKWVLGGGHPVPGWPSFRRFFLSNQLSLFLVRLPLLALFIGRWQWPLALAGLLAILVEGAARYALSEQWVFSRRGLTMWQPAVYRYNVHDILHLESEIALPELAWFAAEEPPPRVDIQVRVDRHGTPSPQPGAITYSEGLGRFGFGVAIMPGDYTEVVVSPALEKSPYALYKSILEPVLRWALARRGYALAYGGCFAWGEAATLLVPAEDKGKTEAVLTAVQSGARFLSDDFTILREDGRVFCFPKPVTLAGDTAVPATKSRFRLQNLIYTSAGRQAGLKLSERRWPVATFNITLQRLLAPPKQSVAQLISGVQYAASARLTRLIWLDESLENGAPLDSDTAIANVQQRQAAANGFPPYAFLLKELGQDILAREQAIIAAALQNCPTISHSPRQLPITDYRLPITEHR
ncbi:MAG TPA: glycosyltransferase [Anaerolineae bacterium]|nr:glycosyltransferase [Anaerolineae bacterium]